MNAMAIPTRLTELLEPEVVLQHRSLFCPDYDDCLETAADSGWCSFSCEKCPLAKATRFVPDEVPSEPSEPTRHERSRATSVAGR